MIGDRVKRALRLVNMGISDAFCNLWKENCRSNLEWNNRERNVIKDMVNNEYWTFIKQRAEENKEQLLLESWDGWKEKLMDDFQ